MPWMRPNSKLLEKLKTLASAMLDLIKSFTLRKEKKKVNLLFHNPLVTGMSETNICWKRQM